MLWTARRPCARFVRPFRFSDLQFFTRDLSCGQKASTDAMRRGGADAPLPAPPLRLGTALQQALCGVRRADRTLAHFVLPRLNVNNDKVARLCLRIVDLRQYMLLEDFIAPTGKLLVAEVATFMGMTGGSGIGMKDGKRGAWNVYRDTFNAERTTQSNAAQRSGSSALLPASLDSSLSSRELNGTTRTQHVTRAYRNSTRFFVSSSEKTRARTFNPRTMSPMVRSLGT